MNKKKREFQRAVIEWGKKNLRSFPWRKDITPYRVLVAETLLRRTTSTAINRLYNKFIKKYPDISSIYNTRQVEIERILKNVGLSKQKATGFKKCAIYIHDHYEGEIPNTYKKLINIPFVGEYTSKALLSFAFGESVPVIDSNVKRVIVRVFSDIFKKETNEVNINDFITDLVPSREHRLFNLSLIDLGSVVCSFTFQKCTICPLRKICMSYRKNI